MLLSFKCRSSVDSVILVIVKTVFVLVLIFDIEKVCWTKYSPKNKYFFASYNNDRGLSLDDETKERLTEIPEVK